MPRKALIWGAGAVAIMAVVCLYAVADPASAGFFPRCPMLAATGWECPGCGAQRALHAILTGEWREAWHCNPFLMVMLPVIALMAVAASCRKSLPRLYRAVNSTPVCVAVGVATVAWWVARNL